MGIVEQSIGNCAPVTIKDLISDGRAGRAGHDAGNASI